MNSKTVANKQQRALQVLNDIHSQGKSFKMPSRWFTEQYIEKIKPIIAKCPQHIRSYIYGYQHALFDQLWQHMEFCYLIDGIWYTTDKCKEGKSNKPNWRTLTDYNMSGKECCHMWLNTEKPYTEISTVT